MQYTPSVGPVRVAPGNDALCPLEVLPTTLLAVLATIPDPRRRQGRRFRLAAVLALAVAAILSNHLSVLAIAEWGKSQSRDLLALLGFPDGVTPHQSTLQRLLRKLDPLPVSRALSQYFAATAVPQGRASQAVAVDGKAQRGRLAFDGLGACVHALSAFCHERGVVLAQVPIDTTGDKAEAELNVAPLLLQGLDWSGRVLTGDALFCQRHLCRQVLAAGGDYLLLVKENQPTLLEDIRLLFDPPPGTPPLSDRREARSREHGHGRHNDVRHLVASTELGGYSDWPGLAQVFRLERTWQDKEGAHQVVQYGITSLPRQIAAASRLLALKRGHWGIENGLHFVKDVTLGEDKSLIHKGAGPAVMAILRDLCVSLLHQNGIRQVAQRLRYHSQHPQEAVHLITRRITKNA